MTFLLPQMLMLGVLLPLLVGCYVWTLRRRRSTALQYASLGLVKSAMGRALLWRRHLPPALLLLALALLVIAAARPSAAVTLPFPRQTILLVMDVSVSMSAEDVAPSRFAASQKAARKFISELPGDVRIGVIAYGGTAHVAQQPTLDRSDVLAAIDGLRLRSSTGIGTAMLLALETIFPEDDFVLPTEAVRRSADVAGLGSDAPPKSTQTAVAPGSNSDAAIVLLSDGQNTAGPSPLDAAQLAADRGVRIYTVGLGTKEGVIVGYQGMRMRVKLDEKALKGVANLTLGQYFYASSGTDLEAVYDALKARMVYEKRETEVTFLFAGAAGLLVAVAALLSMWWSGKVA